MSRMLSEKELVKDRKFLFFVFFAITLFGLLMIYEASSMQAFRATGDAAYYFKKQFAFLAVSIFCFLLTLLVDMDLIQRYSKELLLLTLLSLLLVILLGRSAGGAKRWFSLGGVFIQPSEFLKITFMLYCADYVQRKKSVIKSLALGLAPLGFILGGICLLVLLQPDMGTAVFWVLWILIFLFIFKARLKHLFFVIVSGFGASFLLIRFYPYRVSRIVSYLNPFADPQGAGFQLVQSQIAYGSAGIWGLGFGEGRQKLFFLPAPHTDFIFSVIAEEGGLIASLGFLALFFFLFHKMFRIAKNGGDGFRSAVLWGVLLIFFLEIVINIGVSCGLLPTKGLPLPFISYGGSSLVVHYILLGLFFNASRAVKPPAEPQPAVF
jgi:cell division protein FtsW